MLGLCLASYAELSQESVESTCGEVGVLIQRPRTWVLRLHCLSPTFDPPLTSLRHCPPKSPSLLSRSSCFRQIRADVLTKAET